MGDPIPLNQVERLKQRCKWVDKLFKKDKSNYKRAIFIHVDSRSKGKQTDVFFYHAPGSSKGKRLANNLHRTFDKKYELGNIQNKRDQQRLVLQNNRQALAKWIAEGIVTDYKKGK